MYALGLGLMVASLTHGSDHGVIGLSENQSRQDWLIERSGQCKAVDWTVGILNTQYVQA